MGSRGRTGVRKGRHRPSSAATPHPQIFGGSPEPRSRPPPDPSAPPVPPRPPPPPLLLLPWAASTALSTFAMTSSGHLQREAAVATRAGGAARGGMGQEAVLLAWQARG